MAGSPALRSQVSSIFAFEQATYLISATPGCSHFIYRASLCILNAIFVIFVLIWSKKLIHLMLNIVSATR